MVTTKSFKYLTKRVVLATGSHDVPNRLNVYGENLPFVLHSLTELEDAISSGEARVLLARRENVVTVRTLTIMQSTD